MKKKININPAIKWGDARAFILRDIANKLVELADMLDKEVRQ